MAFPNIENAKPNYIDQTGELFSRVYTNTYVDGTAMTDAKCGGLYNKDENGYFRWGFAGEFPISRLNNPTLANVQKLLNDVGSDKSITVVIDKIINVTANGSLGTKGNIRIETSGSADYATGGFNISAGVTFVLGCPVVMPPFQVIYGDGIFRSQFLKDFDPRWFGARVNFGGSGTYMSGRAFNKCAESAQVSQSNMVIPPGIFWLDETFDPPGNLMIRGGGWYNCQLISRADDVPVVSLASSNTLTDVWIRGAGRASNVLEIPGLTNRVNLRNIRIDGGKQHGLYVERLQNSLIEEVFSQDNATSGSGANIYLSNAGVGPENVTFFNVNGNFSDSTGPAATRYNLYVGNSRNCRFIGGIFERGGIDYPVYIDYSVSLDFYGGEIQSSGKACVYNGNGGVVFMLTSFAMPTIAQGGYAVESKSGALTKLLNCRISGTEGRGENSIYNGTVIIDFDLDYTYLAENYRIRRGGFSPASNSVITWVETDPPGNFGGHQNVTTTSSTGGATRSSTPADRIPIGNTVLITFTIKNINGNGSVNFFATQSNNTEVLIGRFTAGTWTIPFTATSEMLNTWVFRNNENIATKSWEIYEFYVEAVNGVPVTLPQLGISEIYGYDTMTTNVINMGDLNNNQRDISANTTFTFTNVSNGRKKEISLYNSSASDVTISFTGARIATGASLTIPATSYAHISICVHRNTPEVSSVLLS